MSNQTKIKSDYQDKKSLAWKKLCEYIDKVADEELEEFAPLEALGQEMYFQIFILPESIGKLKKVKKMWLYGSKLKRIPPEIGQMESLEYFDPYTSYDLMWFPYEITRCKKLIDSRVSTRAVYGNYKNRKPFPDLSNNPVKYQSEKIKCSICEKEMLQSETNQLWITLHIGTDTLPLLVNSCSPECEQTLPKPPEGYIQTAHKGGVDLKFPQPVFPGVVVQIPDEPSENLRGKSDEPPKPLKLIRKIWEK